MAGYVGTGSILIGSAALRPPAAQHPNAIYVVEDDDTIFRSIGGQWRQLGSGGATDWAGITGKPATFPPASHTHPAAEITGLDTSLIPTQGQKNAMSGSAGVPGIGNEFLTKQDPSRTDARTPVAHSHATSETWLANALAAKQDAATAATDTELASGLAAKQSTSEKGQANGYPGLDGTGKVPAAQLPAASGGFSWEAVLRQAADLSNSTVTLANTDLFFPFAANGVYAVDLYLLAQAAAATTGFGFAFDTSVAVTVAALTFAHVLANTGTVTAGQSRADAAAAGLSSGVDTANQIVPILGSGLVVAGATAGTARLVFRPEVAAAATFKANSVMRVHRVA